MFSGPGSGRPQGAQQRRQYGVAALDKGQPFSADCALSWCRCCALNMTILTGKSTSKNHIRSLRLVAQDAGLSRRKQGFDSPRERQFTARKQNKDVIVTLQAVTGSLLLAVNVVALAFMSATIIMPFTKKRKPRHLHSIPTKRTPGGNTFRARSIQQSRAIVNRSGQK